MTLNPTLRSGYALIVVLSTLSIIALLFAIASSRAITRLSEVKTDQLVAQRAFETAELLQLAIAAYGANDKNLQLDDTLTVTWLGEEAVLHLQDVGGLIDLNTANPALLERFAEKISMSSLEIDQYRDWRRNSLRLLRSDDFFRVSGYDDDLPDRIKDLTTVHSGRTGIAPARVPIELLELLTSERGNREILLDRLPEGWFTPESGLNFQVVLSPLKAPKRALGEISFSSGLADGKVLQIFFP